MKALVILTASLSMAGCTTIERHPRATAIVVGIVAASLVVSNNVHHHDNPCVNTGCPAPGHQVP